MKNSITLARPLTRDEIFAELKAQLYSSQRLQKVGNAEIVLGARYHFFRPYPRELFGHLETTSGQTLIQYNLRFGLFPRAMVGALAAVGIAGSLAFVGNEMIMGTVQWTPPANENVPWYVPLIFLSTYFFGLLLLVFYMKLISRGQDRELEAALRQAISNLACPNK